MSDSDHDLAIAGGGLAGGLVALALNKLRPELDIVLIEAEGQFGGNHIWSFFDSDIAPEHRWLVDPLVSHHWDSYDVHFPKYDRTLATGYNSIKSEDFDELLRTTLPETSLMSGRQIAQIKPAIITFQEGEEIHPKAILDASGGDADRYSALEFGWQKFCGQTLKLKSPHGLARPIIMDATVDQIDGYRFIYCLPLGPDEVFVEDTYYSGTSDLDEALCHAHIAQYVMTQGWVVEKTSRNERGRLPVIFGGNFDKFWNNQQWVEARIGAGAALIHPVTSYSLPMAIRTAVMIAEMPEITQAKLDNCLKDHAARHWNNSKFYRSLCAMMFNAGKPENRYRTLEHTYSKDQKLIERFYAGRTTKRDQAALLFGRPPVPVAEAISALMKHK